MSATRVKVDVGSYLCFRERSLFEVVAINGEEIRTVNSRTLHPTTFDADDLDDARVVVPLLDEEMASFELASLLAPDPTSAADARPDSPSNGSPAGFDTTIEIAPDDLEPDPFTD